MQKKHSVNIQGGVSIHREIPVMRSSKDFDTSKMSTETKEAWVRVCGTGGATPEDYKHVFSSIMSSGLVEEILK